MSRPVMIVSGIAVALIAFAVGYVLSPRVAKAPSGTGSMALPAGAAVTPMSIVSIHESASTSPSVSIEYPQFPSLPPELDEAIASATLTRLARFQQSAAETMQARAATGDPSAVLPASDYDFIATWEPAQINSRYISFIERYSYYAGGANGNEELQTFNYDIGKGRTMALADLFPGTPDYLSRISDMARTELVDSTGAMSGGNAPVSMIDQGTAPVASNFQDFTFTGHQVSLYFPKYAVAPGSFGEQHVTIDRGSIK